MIPFTSLTGLIEYALILGALTLPFTKILSFKIRLFIFVLAFSLAWIPVNTLFVAGYMRGMAGDLSLSSMILILIYIFRSLLKIKLSVFKNAKIPAFIVLFTGIFFYPLSMGVFQIDPYGMAYDPKILSLFLFVLALIGWHLDHYLIVACLCVGVAGYIFRILESDNLWDYILDPLLFIVAAVYLIMKFIKGKKEKDEHSIQ